MRRIGTFGYNEQMERIVDKGIIAVCCVAALLFIPYSVEVVVAFLLAFIISGLRETRMVPPEISAVAIGGYLAGALFIPACSMFVPLMAYDCFRIRYRSVRMVWTIPLFLAVNTLSSQVLLYIGLIALVACCLSWRTSRVEAERRDYIRLRDDLRESSVTLEQKNQDLKEKQTHEITGATLAERARIAREIHDNVGHLLTRSVLQVEALQVVHANDQVIRSELEQIGSTLHEAFDTVRESVHALHAESVDLQMQLKKIVYENQNLTLSLTCQVEDVPPAVTYGILAVVREALANTLRHSDAGRVMISVVEYPAFWQVIIHDNGTRNPFVRKNFPSSLSKEEQGSFFEVSKKTNDGMGLHTMEERVQSLNGIFRITYEQGFRIFISIPKKGNDA